MIAVVLTNTFCFCSHVSFPFVLLFSRRKQQEAEAARQRERRRRDQYIAAVKMVERDLGGRLER